MATRKEQLAAVAFARRRVLGALLRPGAPNPDEAAPRPARTAFGALVVVTVALGAAAVTGFLSPGPASDDWRKGLIKDRAGTSYVLLAGRLHQVANQASAKLILGPGAQTSVQSDQVLADLKPNQGSMVGLADAPDPLPKAADLDLLDWSVCATAAGQIVVEVGYPAAPSATGTLTGSAALLAQDDAGQQWVVTGGLKYKVLDRANVVAAFHAQAVKPRHVPSSWLAGLAPGDPLGIPTISGKFGAAVTHPTPPGFNRIGMFGASTATDGSPLYYLVTGEGLVSVSPAMYELYQREPRLAPAKFTAQKLPAGTVTPDMLAAVQETVSWPVEPPTFAPTSQNPQDPASVALCAAFDGSFDQQGHPHTVVSVSAALPHALPALSTPAATQILVRPGHAALIRTTGTDTATATCHLLTDNGIRYQLVGNAAAQLGYAAAACTDVPGEWLRLIPAGTALDPARAAEPVQTVQTPNPTSASAGQTSITADPPAPAMPPALPLPVQPGSS